MRTRWKKHAAAWACYVLLGAVAGVVVAWVAISNVSADGREFTEGPVSIEGLHLYIIADRSATNAGCHIQGFDNAALMLREVERRAAIPTPDGGVIGALTEAPSWAVAEIRKRREHLTPPSPDITRSMGVYVSGWPMHCVKGATTYAEDATPRVMFFGLIRDVVKMPLPYLILWPGLLLNAILYSPVFFALHEAWRWWVRHLRRSNGLCPTCAYDRKGLAETAPCPECGLAPRPRPAPAS
ncbi:MAG TPA: hypothetical protein VD997_16120 [Phycisphaerales bacterium]|nr:hypothetical protein [Phycisphaerales bacterium]